MTKLSTPGTGPSQRSAAESDIYTVLLVVASLFLLVATVYVGWRAQMLFGSVMPPAGG